MNIDLFLKVARIHGKPTSLAPKRIKDAGSLAMEATASQDNHKVENASAYGFRNARLELTRRNQKPNIKRTTKKMLMILT